MGETHTQGYHSKTAENSKKKENILKTARRKWNILYKRTKIHTVLSST